MNEPILTGAIARHQNFVGHAYSDARERVMDFPDNTSDNDRVAAWRVQVGEPLPTTPIMIEKTPITRATGQPLATETDEQRFERILLRPEFKALKDVFDNLGIAVALMQGAIVTTNSYQMFLGKVGYRVVVVKQIHENDCYSRLGPKGGIRAVLPIHDIATYSTMVTLVNFDSTVTTTANSVDFYDDQLTEFKTQLMSRSGNAE